MQDLKFALRQLAKNPGFTAVAVITLALGIGANTAIFSVLQAVLWRGLPYRNPEELVLISERDPANAGLLTAATPASCVDWWNQQTCFRELAAVGFSNFNLSDVATPERLPAGMATPNLFSLLGAQPLLGRSFRPEEGETGRRDVVMISHAFWQRHFGGRPNVIGAALTLNSRPHRVVGVLPASFHFEHPVGLAGWAPGWGEADVWRPFPISDEGDRTNRVSHCLLALARLKPGVSVARAQVDMETIARHARQAHPDYRWGVNVAPWRERVVGRSRPALALLAGATVFVLLIACANVAHLLLARASARQKEFSIRIALGASRWNLARQLLSEGLVLAALGGAVGMALARCGVAVAAPMGAAGLPRLQTVRFDPGVFGFAACLCGLVPLGFGLIPWWRAFRAGLDEALREGGRSSSESLRRNPWRAALVVMEVASAIVLLSGAGLLLRGFVALSRVDPGFQAGHIVALDVSLVDKRYLDEHRRIEYTQAMVEAAKALPGVDEAAGIFGLPLGSMVNVAFDFSLEGAPIRSPGQEWRTAFRLASPGYFRLLGVPLKAGRDFSGQDRTNTPQVAIVNEAFVRRFLPSTDPISQRIRVADSLDPKVSGNPTEIVGVVGDVKADALDGPAPPELYRPFSQACEFYVSLVVRAADTGVGFQQALRQAVNAVDPRCPVYQVRMLDSQISRSLAPRRFTLGVIWLFAAVALGLAAVGVYGVMAYSVSRRTRELGIRLALGASPNAVLGLILREGLSLAVLGTLLGIGLSLGLSGLLSHQLYGISATDPLTLILVALVLIVTAALACWWPARRAARVDPMAALKRE